MHRPSISQRRSAGRANLAMIAVLSTVALGAVLPAAGQAGNRPPLGKYTCLYPGTPSSFHPLKLVTRDQYTIDGAKKAKYVFKNQKINFKKGAYSDYYGRYESDQKRIVIYDKETNFRFWNCDK